MKKAQAAMEFLMTYGWAILMVLLSIGVVSQTVLKGDSFLPVQCKLSSGFHCESFNLKTTGASFVIRNYIGKIVAVKSIDMPDINCSGNTNVVIQRDEEEVVNINCTLSEGKKKSELIVYYDEINGLSNVTNKGKIVAKVV